jgi:predicted lipoprotein with Yx(FWY)xxD motif
MEDCRIRLGCMRSVVLLLGVLLLGCAAPSGSGPTPASSASPGPASSASSTPPKPPASSHSPEPAGTQIIAADSDFGLVLHDASGQPIYLFDAEASSQPKCYGECADAWPPVLTKGEPHASGPVRLDLLGTTPRRDGSTQITYAGHPLYFYAHEGKYQVLCHNVTEFGGTWLVVMPNGKPASS